MPEGHEIPQQKVYPGISFEPGNHLGLGKEMKLRIDRLARGDLTAHFWHNEIIQRVREKGAPLIALDGLVPPSVWEDTLSEWFNKPKFKTWLFLPDRPANLNNRKEITVIAGDIGVNFSGNLDTNIGDAESSYSVGVLERMMNDRLMNEIGSSEYPNLNEAGAFAIPPALLIMARAFHNMRLEERMTRRDFLKLAGKGLGAFTGAFIAREISMNVPGYGAAYALTDEDKKMWQKVNTMFRSRFFTSDWLDMRSALLIGKTQDTIDYLRMPNSTKADIVMGSAHDEQSKELMQSEKQRETVIRRYTTQLLTTFEELLSQFPGLNSQQVTQVRQNIKDIVARVDLIKVTDPGGPDKIPDIKAFIETNVKLIGTFQSPQVESALQGL